MEGGRKGREGWRVEGKEILDEVEEGKRKRGKEKRREGRK